ncbi:helix-turn-helix transcriptional regulator [Macrococcoides bohemicum]|uniref:helix-turn-helix transcriptional regulator n=1 Tax=Macrococcoides bohemicum TaxID=1903056 RepID=UPI00165DE0DA|nr:helix-turn-helix domain-containing protein [Macrococcus bohemicus]MBC9873863.1 helix-turn-helix domain-containing protein [Macrococcus bohemicus]
MKLIPMSRELKKEIALKGLSVSGYAGIIGHNKEYISLIVSGKKSPSPKLALKIAESFDKKIEDLFEFDMEEDV